MKFGAVYCIYDDIEYLEISLRPLLPFLSRVLFLISDVPWNGIKSDNSAAIEFVKNFCALHPHCALVEGHWEHEVPQRNFGLDWMFNHDVDYTFIVDSDEICKPGHFENILRVIVCNPGPAAFHLEWNTYWKKSYYRIEPRENYRPVIAVKTSSFLFTGIREGSTAVARSASGVASSGQGYNSALIPPEAAICYHLSYARVDEYMRRKLETNSHAAQFIPGWYENVWLAWTPEMRNLHPVIPEQYQQAVPENMSELPLPLQEFIQRERQGGFR